jgi:hypothetical protein
MNLWIFENETLIKMLEDADHVFNGRVATEAVRQAVLPVIKEIKEELATRGQIIPH